MIDTSKPLETTDQEFTIDPQLAQELASAFVEPYRDLIGLYDLSEKKEEMLAKLKAEVLRGVKGVLAARYKASVKMSAISDLGEYIADAAKRALPQEDAEESYDAQLQRIRDEVEAKISDFHSEADAKEALPAYFDDWCKTTVDEVVRILNQTIGGVN